MPAMCQLCAQRPATVHVTELDAAGARSEMHCCSTCMAEQGWSAQAAPPRVAEMRAAAAAQAKPKPSQTSEDSASVGEAHVSAIPAVCPDCGFSFADYASNNVFGCPGCYAAFAPAIAQLLQRYHGTQEHRERRPETTASEPSSASGGAPGSDSGARRSTTRRRTAAAVRRARVEARLREAVTREQFEEAARLRDELKALDAEAE